MFKLILIASLVALAVAQYGGYGHGGEQGGYGGGEGGYGGHEEHHQPIPYKYGYEIHGGDEHHGDFSQSRQEHSDGHGNVQGSYSYRDAHGNQRHVEYIADHHGFRAKVQTNEPGTESQSPADVEFHSSAHNQHGGQGGYGGYGGSYGGSHGLY